MVYYGLIIHRLEGLMSNYENAKKEADKIDERIINLISQNNHVKVEAGAGAGKTYSLHKVIDWFILNKIKELNKQQRKIACITYTNAAVEIIKQRLGNKKEIVPSTIHSFAWENIKQFQSTMIDIVLKLELVSESESLEFDKIAYTLGIRYIEDGILYLHHNDVLKIFISFLDNVKFRKILQSKYSTILIDEYQDSNKDIMHKFIQHFIETDSGIQICLFGDAWQTIYQTNNACGEINNERIKVVGKTVNFRSANAIVKLLNKIRPSLPQITAIDNFVGECYVVDCNDYNGERRSDGQFRGDIPIEILNDRLKKIEEKMTIGNETIKTLMITHKMLASHQGYDNLLRIMDDRLKDLTDVLFTFVVDIIENIYDSFEYKKISLLYETLKTKQVPISSKSDKIKWNKLFEEMSKKRKESIFDMLELVIDSKIIPVPLEILNIYNDMKNNPDKVYGKGKISELKNVKYSEFVAAKEFFKPNSVYSTDHGVKGEEYDNIIFVISKGWNQYQFDKYLPMSSNRVHEKDIKSFERNRNLFYVGCSRAKKRLCLFITYKVENDFKQYLKNLFGENNYLTYTEFLSLQLT